MDVAFFYHSRPRSNVHSAHVLIPGPESSEHPDTCVYVQKSLDLICWVWPLAVYTLRLFSPVDAMASRHLHKQPCETTMRPNWMFLARAICGRSLSGSTPEPRSQPCGADAYRHFRPQFSCVLLRSFCDEGAFAGKDAKSGVKMVCHAIARCGASGERLVRALASKGGRIGQEKMYAARGCSCISMEVSLMWTSRAHCPSLFNSIDLCSEVTQQDTHLYCYLLLATCRMMLNCCHIDLIQSLHQPSIPSILPKPRHAQTEIPRACLDFQKISR